ncbi:MAG: DUF4124 domain-containing protein [Pseudomonadota bacterium]
MKLFVKLMVFIVVLALMGPFFLKGPDGRPLWELPTRLPSLNEVSNAVVPDALEDPNVEVYRWQDENGQWHFGSTPPASSRYETLQIDTRTNAVAVEPPPTLESRDSDEGAVASSAADQPDSPYVSDVLPIPDPEVAKQLIEDARALQELTQQRTEEIDAILNSQ